MRCRPGGTCEPAVWVLACQTALLQSMQRGCECCPGLGPLGGVARYCVMARQCPFWVPGSGRMGAGMLAGGELLPPSPVSRTSSSCLPVSLTTSAIRKWDCPAPRPGIASASTAAFWRGTHGTTHAAVLDVPRVKALQAMTLVMGPCDAPCPMSPAAWWWLRATHAFGSVPVGRPGLPLRSVASACPGSTFLSLFLQQGRLQLLKSFPSPFPVPRLHCGAGYSPRNLSQGKSERADGIHWSPAKVKPSRRAVFNARAFSLLFPTSAPGCHPAAGCPWQDCRWDHLELPPMEQPPR